MKHSGGKHEEKRNESGAKERMKKLVAKAGMLGSLLLLAGCFCEPPPPPKTDWTVTILAVGLTAITCFLAGSLTMSGMKEQYERSLKDKEVEQQEVEL